MVTFDLLTPTHFSQIEHWFDEVEVQRYLGGRDWLYRAERLMRESPGELFRGRIIEGRYVWIIRKEQPVGLIDVELYDDETAGFSFLIAAQYRGQKLAQQALLTLESRQELQTIHTLRAGVEPQNRVSLRVLHLVGYQLADKVDEEGMIRVRKSI